MKIQLRIVLVTTLILMGLCAGIAQVNAQEPCDGANYFNDTYDDSSSFGWGRIYGVLWIPSSNWIITRIEIFTGEGTGPLGLAIWSDDGSSPSKPFANLGNTAYVSTSLANSWQGANLIDPVAVEAGAKYWIVIHALSQMQSPDEPGGILITHWWNDTGTITGPLSWSWNGPWASCSWKYRVFGFSSVGGAVLEMNAIQVVTPYIAIALMAAGTVAFLRRKRLP